MRACARVCVCVRAHARVAGCVHVSVGVCMLVQLGGCLSSLSYTRPACFSGRCAKANSTGSLVTLDT